MSEAKWGIGVPSAGEGATSVREAQHGAVARPTPFWTTLPPLNAENAKRYGGQCEECRVYGSGHAPECSKDQAYRERYARVLMREGWTEDQALKLAGLKSREEDFANHISLRHPLLDAARESSPECSDEEAA